MFKEILRIIPQISSSDLNKMERSLSQRFTKVAKKFGKGLTGALAGGGIAGLALGLIDKLLNPLKETQEAIDRTLKQGDDIVTNAKQFGASTGKLFKLQSLAKNQGLEPDALYMLINKFQTAVAEAAADPKKQTSVRNFVGDKDTVESFSQFIQALAKMDKNQQLLVQQEVFGEKQTLKMAEFLEAAKDFGSLIKATGLKSAEAYTPKIERLADLEQLQRNLETQREARDIEKKGGLINEGMIKRQDQLAQQELNLENQRIASYQSLASISAAANKITGLMENGLTMVATLVDKLTNLTGMIQKFSGSRFLRGVIPKWLGGEDN